RSVRRSMFFIRFSPVGFPFGNPTLPVCHWRIGSEWLKVEPATAPLPGETKPPMPFPPTRALIREVGLRDGLQSIRTILPTERKKRWIQAAHAAGQREIEVGSFVPAKRLPQLADTGELVAFARTLPGLSVSVLVPNLQRAERAIDAQADSLLVPLS